jgi:hypothetical protein
MVICMQEKISGSEFTVGFSDREVTSWGGMAILKQMLDSMNFQQALTSWDLPQPLSNRAYSSEQLIEQFIVSTWCGASRFAHAEMVRLDPTLTKIFGWQKAAEFKAIQRLFARFDMTKNEQVQQKIYRWLFDYLPALSQVTLDLDSTVITRNGEQEGSARGYNPNKRGRLSHHPLLAFVAEARLVANFWLRPGNTTSSNNVLQFLESTLANLGNKRVGLLRADSGFYNQTFLSELENKEIQYVISAKMTQPIQRKLYQHQQWWALETGLEVSEFYYQAEDWSSPRRMILMRQSTIERKQAKGKNLKLFGDDPDIQGWRYSAYVTSLTLPAVEVWRIYRGRADCENRIKELKYDFGLDAFNMRNFWATEAALGFAMLSYNLMSVFRQAVLRTRVQHTLTTLHGQILAIGGSWSHKNKQHLLLSLTRKKRAWFSGLWEQASKPPNLTCAFTIF